MRSLTRGVIMNSYSLISEVSRPQIAHRLKPSRTSEVARLVVCYIYIYMSARGAGGYVFT